MMDASRTRRHLESRYDVNWKLVPLGVGSFGTVHRATDRRSGERVALKKITKKFTDDVSFQREMQSLLFVRAHGGHPHICALRENFDDDGGQHYYLIFDLVSGGEMFDHLIENGAYSEADAARLVREVASALAYLHGIGIVHADLKPENIMLSTNSSSDAVIKLVDFGCAEILPQGLNEMDIDGDAPVVSKRNYNNNGLIGATPAYCPPETLVDRTPLAPPHDMWSLGVILYIMLTGLHPFDLQGKATDQQIEQRIKNRESPPLRNSPITAHLSPSAVDLIEKLMSWDAKDRLTAQEMLVHPWVTGETASTNVMANSDKKLTLFRRFKSRIEAKVFSDIVHWSDENHTQADVGDDEDTITKKTSLIERSFRQFDTQRKGFLTANDFKGVTEQDGKDGHAGGAGGTEGDDEELTLSGFSDLLSENMKNRFFPKGETIYREGDKGDRMYFINSGAIDVSTADGCTARRTQGDFFGEGALLHPLGVRSATIRTVTPVHAIEISKEYFEKYLASSESLSLVMREKDKARKRNRAKTLLRLQKSLKELNVQMGDYLYQQGEEGKALYILEKGHVDVTVRGKTVFSLKPGDLCGEHSPLTGRPRNTSAICMSDECKVYELKSRDFYTLLDGSPAMKDSLHEICLRREVQKAFVYKTGKAFPSEDKLREAFDLIDVDSSGSLSYEDIKQILHNMDPAIQDEEVMEVIKTMDLNNSGDITFEEFKHVFAFNEKRARSI